MRVLFVTSEAYPLAKSGGLADVSAALPGALADLGVDARILMPGYPSALMNLRNPRIEARLEPRIGVADAVLISGELPDRGVPVWLIYAPSLFSRKGGLYQSPDGADWPDNALRFAFLAHTGAQIALGRIGFWKPDIVHANDWHAGLLPLLLSAQASHRPASILTIHNLAFQGNFPQSAMAVAGLPDRLFSPDGVEFYGQLSFLKAGIRYSDKITTVSPTYAREVLTPAFGFGMDGILRHRSSDFAGILNGIDTKSWNPETNTALAGRYGSHDISGKRLCKAALQREMGLPVEPETPLIAFISRLAHQKMADVVADALPHIVRSGAQFALVGEGDPALEHSFASRSSLEGTRTAVHIGYDEKLAHRLQAGADIVLAPARYEPCGLTQLYALRYGTIPIVRKTGGLADTVTDATIASLSNRTATGIVFERADLSGLIGAIDRALALYKEPLTWRRLQLQAMAQNFSWNASAAKYVALYHQVTGVPPSEASHEAETGQKRRSSAG